MAQPNVLVAVPTMGAMHPSLTATLLEWSRQFPPEQLSFYFTFKVSPVDRARNEIVRWFLANEAKFTHLLFVDSDTIPPASHRTRAQHLRIFGSGPCGCRRPHRELLHSE
jgi:hypothetical protein